MGDETLLLERILNGEDDPKDLPLALLQRITNDFSQDRKIGQGGFGVVYKGVLRNEIIVAVKRMYVNQHTVDDRSFRREINSLMKINHQNVVRFLGFCSHAYHTSIKEAGSTDLNFINVRERLLCLEYINNASLDKHITDELRGFEWKTRYEIIMGICKGLCYLHEETKIVHMDLKPANILLDDHMVPKLTDFGLSRPNENSHTMGQRFGTRGYLAPEYENAGKTSVKSDIYSLGAIIIELVTGCMAIPDKNNVLRRWRHRWSKPPTLLQYQQVTRCIAIAARCRQQEPEARPSIGDIISILIESESTDGHTDQESTNLDDDMLRIEPLELKLNEEMSWSVKLTNKTMACFAFNIERPSQQYTIRPDKGIVPPECNEYLVQITLQPQQRAPQVTQNADKIIFQSTKVPEGLRDEDITEHIFHEGVGKVVDEVDLMIVHEPTKPQDNFRSREDANMSAWEVPEAKKREIVESASGEGKNKLGSSEKAEATSINESLKTKLDMLKPEVAELKKAYRCHRQPTDDEASKAFKYIKQSDIADAIKKGEAFAKGGFGIVYKCELDGRDVAIKVPRDLNLPRETKAFKDEVEILRRIHHPHIVILHGACVDECALVYEFLPNGTLEKRLKEGKGNDSFPWEKRIHVAANISTALVHLHDSSPHPIAHGDLKPNNILFDAENICKLGDFGISRFLQHNTTGGTPCHNTDEPMGTGPYMDPDFNSRYKKLTRLADQFAFGIILLELVTGRGALGLRKKVSEQMKTLDGKSKDKKIGFLSKLNLMDTAWKSSDKSKEVALEMLALGLRCSEEKRKDRPDFKEEVWTKIKSITCEEVPGTAASQQE